MRQNKTKRKMERNGKNLQIIFKKSRKNRIKNRGDNPTNNKMGDL